MKQFLLVTFSFIHMVGWAQKSSADLTELIQPSVFALSKVMMHDVVSPPAASRYYAYCLLGAYEIASQQDTTLPPLSALIKNYSRTPITSDAHSYNYKLAALYAILETGRQLLPSGYTLEEDQKKLVQVFQKKVSKVIIQQSISVAKDVTAQIISFSKGDHYNQLSARLRYTPVRGEGMWYPTPPAYIEAVEPNWKTIRPLLLDTCSEFMPARPIAFSTDSNSRFYALANEVYAVSKKRTPEQTAMAAFWDCNPFAVATAGHLSIGFKKISPGGHWMNIASIASAKASLSFSQAVLVQTMVAVTLMDAFISCWDEKYRSNRIRPETYINRYLDARWEPLLQTPPFPEYPSGHSVISTAAAEVLSYLLGESFSYVDNSEVLFDIPPRPFTSFRQAAAEAAISRLYGGIHFRDAVENGQQQGKGLGEMIVARLKAAGIATFSKPHMAPTALSTPN